MAFKIPEDDLHAEIQLLRFEQSIPKGNSTSTLCAWLDWLKEVIGTASLVHFPKLYKYFNHSPDNLFV
jgi:hypothetical protein